MNIRRASIDDAELIARLNEPVQRMHAEARPDFFKPYTLDDDLITFYIDLLIAPENHIFIGEVDGQAVGYVYAKLNRRPESPFTFAIDEIVIDQISVNDDQRGKGCGEKLMQAVYDLAKAEHIQRVMLMVWDFNSHAIGFYKKLGFRVYSERMELQ